MIFWDKNYTILFNDLIFDQFEQINQKIMEIQRIKQTLADPYLGLDKTTVQESIRFIQSWIGIQSMNLDQYKVLSAAAMVGETRNVLKINGQGFTRTGITLENIMKNIGKRSKEQFLEVLTWTLGKWREAPMWISVKIDNLKLSYRIYKKFRFMFQEMFNSCTSPAGKNKSSIMAILWITYVFIKHENKHLDSAFQMIPLMKTITQILYVQIVGLGSRQQCHNIFIKHFIGTLQTSQQEFIMYKTLFFKKIDEINEIRKDEFSKFDFSFVVQNQYYIERFLSDLTNKYDKFRGELQDKGNLIDEVSYLELSRDKSPYIVKRNIAGINKAITKKLNLLEDSEEESNESEDNQMEEEEPVRKQTKQQVVIVNNKYGLSPIKFKNNQMTPVRSRYQNLGWINTILSKFNQLQIENFKKIYERFSEKSYQEYQIFTLQRIQRSAIRYTDSKKRVQSIFRFFIYFINKIADEQTEQEKSIIFSSEQSINSILCLSTDIFNYTYHSNQASYRQNCQIFNVSLLEGHKPINWFGLCKKLPKNIEEYLYDLQKKILIRQIWQNSEGFDLLSLDPEQKSKYNNQALLKRLNHHIDGRIKQLCDKMNISDKQMTKVHNLVRYILQKKVILLKNHNIDQVIVCSIASILSVNYSKSKFTLNEIFEYYNSMIYSFYSSKNSLFDISGNQIDLIQFYNQIFLQEIQSIINQQEDSANILMTPIILQRKRSKQSGYMLTPVPIKFKQNSLYMPRKMIKTQSEGRQYRLNLANSLENMDILQKSENEENDEVFTPSFNQSFNKEEGSAPPSKMKRSFSFGNIDFP